MFLIFSIPFQPKSEIKLLHEPKANIDKSIQYTHMEQRKIVNWTRTLQTQENECIFVAFAVLFPWPLWTALSTYAILNASLIASAVYKYVYNNIF